jgi:hypothetical protein
MVIDLDVSAANTDDPLDRAMRLPDAVTAAGLGRTVPTGCPRHRGIAKKMGELPVG